MNHLWILIVLVVLCVALKPLKRVFMLLFLRTALRGRMEDIGKQAVAKQPDTIHLTPNPDHAWANRAAVEALAAPLASLGFAEAGTYGIDEMAGVVTRFLVQTEQRVAACIYEHPKAGTWIDFFSHYQDGTGFTCTTAKPTGLDQRPGAPTVHAPGTDSEALYQRMLRERPAGAMEAMTAATVVERFVDAYARASVWRKNKGVSADEMARQIKRYALSGPISPSGSQ